MKTGEVQIKKALNVLDAFCCNKSGNNVATNLNIIAEMVNCVLIQALPIYTKRQIDFRILWISFVSSKHSAAAPYYCNHHLQLLTQLFATIRGL